MRGAYTSVTTGPRSDRMYTASGEPSNCGTTTGNPAVRRPISSVLRCPRPRLDPRLDGEAAARGNGVGERVGTGVITTPCMPSQCAIAVLTGGTPRAIARIEATAARIIAHRLLVGRGAGAASRARTSDASGGGC